MFLSPLRGLAQCRGLFALEQDSLVNFLNTGRPMELLQKSLSSQVLVELKGKRKLKGKLRGYDQHLNLILEDAEEITIDLESEQETVESIKTVIVRGDNVVIVSPPPKAPKK